MAMYNQFILEELKTLKDLLEAGAITQGEFDHLKQILIDGTKVSNETLEINHAETITAGDVYENPEEVIRYYSNETKNLLLYKQFDKAYPFVQKILSLRPEHREATRFLHEIKTFVRRDYMIGGAIGILVACIFSYVLTLSKDVNLILLCVVPILSGLLLPRLASNLLIGRVNSRGMRYLISGGSVLMVGCVFNVMLSSGLVQLEKSIFGKSDLPLADMSTLDSSGVYVNTDDLGETQTNSQPEDTATASSEWDTPVDGPTDQVVANTVDEPQTSKKPVETVATGNLEKTPKETREQKPEENSKEISLKGILNAYYRDLSNQKFDADKYYAKEVDRFFNLRDVSPQTITDEVRNNYYTDFQDAVSTVDGKTLEISPVKGGRYQADFTEIIKCYRKTAKQHQTITAKVKIVFDRNMKIIYHSSQATSSDEFGERAARKTLSKMVYYQKDSQPN
jgi:hypothetical protein